MAGTVVAPHMWEQSPMFFICLDYGHSLEQTFKPSYKKKSAHFDLMKPRSNSLAKTTKG